MGLKENICLFSEDSMGDPVNYFREPSSRFSIFPLRLLSNGS
jgi:hypothetical protein